ncbi:uncharacterized protein LOC144903218 [Branchiostoma floridae x Branchiostoma belcheri]
MSAESTISAGSVLSSDSGYASASSHVSEGRKTAEKYKVSVEAAISKMTEGLKNLDKERTATAENCSQVKKEIQQHYKNLISKLQLEEQEMVSKVENVTKDRNNELIHSKEEMEKDLANTRKDLALCQKSLDTEVFNLKQVKERMLHYDQMASKQSGNRTLEGHTKMTFQPSDLSQVSGGSLSVLKARFTIDVQKPAVESLPCSVTVTTNNADLTGGKVAPQIEVTSPQGKTTLIQTTHTGPPLAAGKGQTSRVSRVWGAEWRPQQSGKHTLGVCIWGMEDLCSLTVDVSCNNPVVRIGERGSQQGQFDGPVDVAVRGDRLYVADTRNQRVQVFDLSGKFCHSFPTDWPVALAVQTDGTIVVNSGKEVKKFSPSGELLHKFPLGEYCTNPYGLAVQRNGRVVLADYGKHSIFLYEADGTLVKQVGGRGKEEGQFDWPRFVCVDKEDNIIVADKNNHRVQVFDKNLNYKHKFGQKGRQLQDMWGPMGGSADSRGNIVLANSGGKKLQVFRPDSTWVSTISSDGDKLNSPHGVAVTEDGHVFVADHIDDCIRKYRYM